MIPCCGARFRSYAAATIGLKCFIVSKDAAHNFSHSAERAMFWMLWGRWVGLFHCHRDTRFLVGGGIGVPPLVFLAEKNYHKKISVSRETRVEAFIGARSAEDVVEEATLLAATDAVTIATQDGSAGEQGLVTVPLERRLRELTVGAGDGGRGGISVCACGPWPMLRAVAQLCAVYGVRCQVSMEENMPCGIGVCNGCVVPMLNASDEYGRFQRICVEGPVMDAAQVDWGDTAVTVGLEDGRTAHDSA